MLRALTTLFIVVCALGFLVACGSSGVRRDQKAVARSETTEQPRAGGVPAAATASVDPALVTYREQANLARIDLELGIEDVMAYAGRLAGGTSMHVGDERVFVRIGRCRATVRRLTPPPEMQQVQALLRDACSESRQGSLELVDAFGTGDVYLARQAAKHLAKATLELDQVRKELEG